MRRVRRKLVIFYSAYLTIEAIFATLTVCFWDVPHYDEEPSWEVDFCKAFPLTVLTLFGLFNVWI